MSYRQNFYPRNIPQQDVILLTSSGLGVSLSDIQLTNQLVASVKEYNKNYDDVSEVRTLTQRQVELSVLPIMRTPFLFAHVGAYGIDKELQDTVHALVSGTKTSDQAAIVLLLTNILIAIQGNIYVNLEPGHYEYPSIYALFGSEPGTRKSTVMKRGLGPFEQFMDEIYGNCVSNDTGQMVKSEIMRKARKELVPMIDSLFDNFDVDGAKPLNEDIVSLSNKVRDIQNAVTPQKQDLLVGSCTSAGLAALLAKNNGHLAIASAEGDIMPNLLKDKQLISYFKHCYDFEDISRTTGRSKITVSRPSLNLSLYIQPSELVKILNDADMQDQGFTARCIFLLNNEPTERYYPHTLDIYNDKILRVLRQFFCHHGSRQIHTIKASDDAVRELKIFEKYIKANIMPTYPKKSYPALRKLHGLAARFALAYHIWITPEPTSKEIALQSMQVGIQIATSLLSQIFFVYHEYGFTARPIAQKILDYILSIDVSQRHKLLQDGIEVSYIAKRIHLTMAVVERGIGYLQRCNALRLYDNGNSKCRVILHSNFFHHYAPQIAPIGMNLFA